MPECFKGKKSPCLNVGYLDWRGPIPELLGVKR